MTYLENVDKSLINIIPQIGKVEWIGVRTERKGTIQILESVFVKKESGLEGDHFKGISSGKRQVTIIQMEHLQTVAKILGRKNIDPELTRRNIVVSGINLLSLKDQKFRIGEVILETTGICAPCSLMETNLGKGGYNVMRGHGGITTKVISEGKLELGDKVKIL